MNSALNSMKKEASWGPDQTKNHHPALIHLLAETMEVDGKWGYNKKYGSTILVTPMDI